MQNLSTPNEYQLESRIYNNLICLAQDPEYKSFNEIHDQKNKKSVFAKLYNFYIKKHITIQQIHVKFTEGIYTHAQEILDDFSQLVENSIAISTKLEKDQDQQIIKLLLDKINQNFVLLSFKILKKIRSFKIEPEELSQKIDSRRYWLKRKTFISEKSQQLIVLKEEYTPSSSSKMPPPNELLKRKLPYEQNVLLIDETPKDFSKKKIKIELLGEQQNFISLVEVQSEAPSKYNAQEEDLNVQLVLNEVYYYCGKHSDCLQRFLQMNIKLVEQWYKKDWNLPTHRYQYEINSILLGRVLLYLSGYFKLNKNTGMVDNGKLDEALMLVEKIKSLEINNFNIYFRKMDYKLNQIQMIWDAHSILNKLHEIDQDECLKLLFKRYPDFQEPPIYKLINGQDSDRIAFLTDFTEIMKDVDILLKSLILINEDDSNKKRLFDDQFKLLTTIQKFLNQEKN